MTDAPLRAQLGSRASRWRAAGERLARLERREPLGIDAALEVADDYRRVAADLATARRVDPSSRTREQLESLYSRLHGELHRPPARPLRALRSMLRDALPESLASLRWHLLAVALLFVVATAAGAWLVGANPGLARLFASSEMITTVERGKLWTEGLLNVVPSSVLSLQILTNNVAVSLFAYCAGLLFGLGTFYIVTLNGLMLGGVFAFTAANGLGGELFRFVVAHGVVELACLCVSGAAGAAVGESLVRPRLGTRRESFARAARETLPVMAAVVLLLLGCGLIEGYVSPDPDIPLAARLVIGFGYFAFMVALLQGWVLGRSRGGRLEY
jgi:uncharacterized membrane protein SpoIIM required for sporulation